MRETSPWRPRAWSNSIRNYIAASCALTFSRPARGRIDRPVRCGIRARPRRTSSAPECTAAGDNHRNPHGPADRLLANPGLDQHSNAATGHFTGPYFIVPRTAASMRFALRLARIPGNTHKTIGAHTG